MNACELSKSVVCNIKDYFLAGKSNEMDQSLTRSLQMLYTAGVISSLEPSQQETVDLFFWVHKLLSTADSSRTSAAWSAITVLQEACKNPVSRKYLIRNFRFVPLLIGILNTQKTVEKQLKVLYLLQELTYRVSLSWQEAYFPQLISTLANWLLTPESELGPVSLHILINLCHRNMAAVYTLARSVDIKALLKALLFLKARDSIISVQVFRLFMILESLSRNPSENDVRSFLQDSSCSLVNAFTSHNSVLLRQIVDLYVEISENTKISSNFNSFSRKELEKLLRAVAEQEEEEKPSSPECLAIIFDHLKSVVGLGPDLVDLFPQVLEVALKSLGPGRSDRVSCQALHLICALTSTLTRTDTAINSAQFSASGNRPQVTAQCFLLLEDYLEVIMNELIGRHGQLNESLGSEEKLEKLTAVLSLLCQLVRVPSLAERLQNSLNPELIRSFFRPLLKEPESSSASLLEESLFTFYVQGLCILVQLTDSEMRSSEWFVLYTTLIHEPKVQSVLAAALFLGQEPVKRNALSLIGSSGFPMECVGLLAKSLSELGRKVGMGGGPLSGGSTWEETLPPTPSSTLPLPDMAHMDSLLRRVESNLGRSDNRAMSELVEVYQGKVALLEKGCEEAERRVGELQRSLAQYSAERSRLHGLVGSLTSEVEGRSKEARLLRQEIETTREEARQTHIKYNQLVQNMKSKSMILEEQKEVINKMEARLAKETEGRESLLVQLKTLQDQKQESQSKVNCLEEEVVTLTKIKSENKKEIEEKTKEIKVLSKAIRDLQKDLQEQKRKIEVISELASGRLNNV